MIVFLGGRVSAKRRIETTSSLEYFLLRDGLDTAPAVGAGV